MATVTVNIEPFKGTYDLDPDIPFSGLEWRWIKKIAGYLPLTINAGFEGDDNDLYIVLAVIALHRAGKIQPSQALRVSDALADAPVNGESILLDFGDEEEAEKAKLAEEGQAELPEAPAPKVL